MVGMALAKSLYAVPTWTRLVALVTEHEALRAAITDGTRTFGPYTGSLQSSTPTAIFSTGVDRVTAALGAAPPSMGRNATKWRCPTGECKAASR